MRTNPCVRLVVFVCSGTDVWCFLFQNIQQLAPRQVRRSICVAMIYYRMIPTCDYVSEDKGRAPVLTVAYTASGLCLYIMFDLLCLFQQK